MAIHDYVIANGSGAAVRSDLNNALAAIVSNNSSSTEPSTTYAYQWWADTNNNVLKIRNAANNGWITLRELDGTMVIEDGTAAAPGLAFTDDVDTGLFRPAANQLGIATSGVERVEFGATEVVFNDGGADVDFRVEGDTEASLLKVDAGNDRIGIAESAPGTLVEIGSTAPYVTLKNSTEEDADGGRESRLIFEGEQSGGEISTLAQIEVSHDGTADDEQGKLVVSTNDGSDGASPTAALTISADQTVAVEDNLTVNGNQYPTAGALSHRNLVINGAQTVSQRGSSFSFAHDGTTSSYTLDRMSFVTSGTDSFDGTVSQSTDAPSGFAKSWKLTTGTAEASIDADDLVYVQTILEAQDLQLLNYGASGAKTITLSFYVKSSVSGTFGVGIYQADAIRNRTATYTINATDTWERKTITFTGDTSGTINDDNGAGFQIAWNLASGSNWDSGNSTAWGAYVNNRWAFGHAQDGVITTASATWQITGIQLELGEKATPFEHRSYANELERCQRYFVRFQGGSGSIDFAPIGSGTCTGLTEAIIYIPTTVTLRANPSFSFSGTVSVHDGSEVETVTAIGIDYAASAAGTWLTITTTSGLTLGRGVFMYTQNATSNHFSVNAEL
tara:strand:- start:2730 stop:4583 length:1854 start_codon:yes stop_codon:yes gene_type:complete